jgi:glycerol-3-phosphate dehydrogenase (NAD(P)+)
VLGPDELEEAAKGSEVAVLGANSNGARSLAKIVRDALDGPKVLVSIAKGLEPESRKRMSEVYGEEIPGVPVVAIGGPSLAAEVAEGLPTVGVYACVDRDALQEAVGCFHSPPAYWADPTDDVAGVEICGTAKNVGAIGAGILEGMGGQREQEYKNARAAIFARACAEMATLLEACGGKRQTAFGMAGVGDLFVTSIGGRNRMYGEAVGAGADPLRHLEDMTARGLTVEGVESAKDVHAIAEERGLDLPLHASVYRIVHDGASPESILETLG